MLTFLLRRIVIAVLVAFTVSVIGFSLLRLSGDLARILAGENASPDDVARIAHAYGLDLPLWKQYVNWLLSALQGDLGTSYYLQEPVAKIILERLPVTATLAVSALIVALVIAIPLGILAAVKANTWIDRLALIFSVGGQAAPNFWFALILINVFAVWWRRASVFGVKLSGISIFGVELSGLPISGSSSWKHYILPTITLALMIMPAIMRLTRAGMIEVLATDYVRTARAKGLSGFSVLFKHALRNAILPVVSLSAVQLGFLLGGSVIVESIFALNGIGYFAYVSIMRVDFPVVQSILVFLACAYILLTLASDLINAVLDPRLRLS